MQDVTRGAARAGSACLPAYPQERAAFYLSVSWGGGGRGRLPFPQETG